jgi:aminoglycoside phosphotransferase (APT) family kinase protein
MKGRPATFQHDDFHPSNINIHQGQYKGVIDFNRYDWGDPYHDFCKVGLYTANVSVPFSIGQLHGYFEQNIPSNFWRLHTVYMGMSIFASIVWSLKQSPSLLSSMLGNLQQIVEDHNSFTKTVPRWYETGLTNIEK